MKLNTKTRYAIRAMIDIAMHSEPGKGVFQKDIAQRQSLSLKYLDQIVASLKSANLIVNSEGKKSGYTLTRSADQINVYDIYVAFEGPLAVIDCLSMPDGCSRKNKCATLDYWQGLNELMVQYFRGKTLQDLTDKQIALEGSENIYYI